MHALKAFLNAFICLLLRRAHAEVRMALLENSSSRKGVAVPFSGHATGKEGSAISDTLPDLGAAYLGNWLKENPGHF